MLTPEQIGEIITKDTYKADRQYHEYLRFQITGLSSQAQIEIIRGFESKHIKEVRDKYSTPINWLWEWVLQPINKIFSSNGGSVIINDSSDKAKEELLLKCANLKHSGTLREWMQKVWKENYLIDPAGIILMENDKEETWPVFYSIDSIKMYGRNGRFLDWVIFNPFDAKIGNQKVKLIRVIDETGDTVYKVDGKKVSKVDSYKDIKTGEEKLGYYQLPKQFENVNGKGGIPAFLIGDIPDNQKQKEALSIIDKQLKLGKEYYQLDTIRIFTAIKNGYGTYYWYTRPCRQCSGEGFIGEHTEENQCKVCGGAGRIYPKNVNDIYLIDVNSDDKLPEKPGGIIEGDIAGWKQYIEQLDIKAKQLELSHWGTHRTETGQNNTATGAFVDVQTANDKANMYASSAEIAESIIFRYIGAFHSATFKNGYIVYGRRHQVESPDSIWDKYEKARSTGAPESTLNKLLLDYYESEYRNDYQNRTRVVKLMAVEPFVHMSVKEVINSTFIDDDEKYKKLYFSQWENSILPNEITTKTIDELKEMLELYVEEITSEFEDDKINSKDLETNKNKDNGKEDDSDNGGETKV